ncbi:MAG: hypothetical protein KKH83_07125 [Candidatus Margulisbacteria bacterium]|nr:hypothetical protein [Candidatus Margulisiibacteriota bacterium]
MPVALDEIKERKITTFQYTPEKQCIFYKKDSCNPNKIKYAICKKCHRSRVITLDTAVPRLFERIISMAKMFMKIMPSARSKD